MLDYFKIVKPKKSRLNRRVPAILFIRSRKFNRLEQGIIPAEHTVPPAVDGFKLANACTANAPGPTGYQATAWSDMTWE